MSSSASKSKKTAFAGVGASKARRSIAPGVGSQSRIGKSIYGGASRSVLSSSSRKNVQIGQLDKLAGPAKAPVQVFDASGQDVTPLPLLQHDPNTVRKNQSTILTDGSAGTPTDLMSQASIYQTGNVTASTFGGLLTRSIFSASQSERSGSSIADELGEPAVDISAGWSATKTVKREETEEELMESDLQKSVTFNLTETDTIWLLDFPGVCVQQDNEEATTIREQNVRYKELVTSRVGNDRYVERGMNTFNEAPKVKSVQTTKIAYNDAGVMATTWDMHDTYKTVAEEEAIAAKLKEEEEEEESVSRPASASKSSEKKDEDKSLPASGSEHKPPLGLDSQLTTSSGMTGTESLFGSKESGVTAVPDQQAIDENAVLESENFRIDLVVMERVINLNTYQPRQASYRHLAHVPDIDKAVSEEEKPVSAGKISVGELGPNLDRLWAYQCPLTKGRNVSFVAWNKVNPDLLAVAYGQFEFTKQKSGLVCCWSLKNPEFPERVYICEAGATSMDFSLAHPNLLAVGLYDGTVAVYNVRSTKNETVLDSFDASGKHAGPVWQLKWIEKERGSGEDKSEVLVSISTDGRVTQWSIRKGLESYDLMKLKRVQVKSSQSRQRKTEALISKHAGGLCFDFNAKDSNIYLAGTEEGHIHKCSCSYNEQYLDSYFGHTGPVYKIQWSPFCPDVFLSCSGDWGVRLWHQDESQSILDFSSSTKKAVHDVCWSPRYATVFACVNEGSVEVWDFGQDPLDPIIVNVAQLDVKMCSVTFAQNSECLLVGDSEGAVSVYQLREMGEPPADQAEALQKVIQASSNQLTNK